MKRLIVPIVLAGMAAAVGGCQDDSYRVQPLGKVDYLTAFEAGKAVFARHFAVASADSGTGEIIAQPKAVEGAADRLLGRSAARELATMRIRRSDEGVAAEVRVEVQRQDVGAYPPLQPVTSDNELPSRTSAQESAPSAAQQKADWRPAGRNEPLEAAILTELLRRLESR